MWVAACALIVFTLDASGDGLAFAGQNDAALKVFADENGGLHLAVAPAGRTFSLRDRPILIAWCPDLDGDGWRDIRILYRPRDGRGILTEIRAFRDGVTLFEIEGIWPFNPWAPVPGDSDQDGQITPADIILARAARTVGTTIFSTALGSYGLNTFHELTKSHLPRNVTVPGAVSPAQLSTHDNGMQTPGPLLAITATLRTVRFGGNAHDVYRDHTGQVPYLKMWLDKNGDGDAMDFADGENRDPLCYTINNTVQVAGVTVRVEPVNPLGINWGNSTIVGSVDGQDVFTGTNLQTQTIGNLFLVFSTNVSGTLAGPNTINLWDDKLISWRLVVDEGGAFATYNAGTSDHDIHFVLADPTGRFKLFYTLIDIACREAAGLDGSDVGSIAAAIFEEFDDLMVVRAQDKLEQANPEPMAYYADWLNSNTAMEHLLRDGDGQCGAWALLFMRCIHAAGVDMPNEFVMFSTVYSPNIDGALAHFFVEEWTFGAQSNPDPATQGDWPHLNVPESPFIAGNQHHWCFNDVSDATGVPGQRPVQNPHSLFSNHQVILVGETLYDVPYGETYGTGGAVGDAMLAAIDSGAIEAYGLLYNVQAGRTIPLDEPYVGCDLNDDGDEDDLGVLHALFVIRQNPAGNQLKIDAQINHLR